MCNNPKADAESRERRIHAAHPELRDLPVRAQGILHENIRFKLKAVRLYQLADQMKAILESFVICGPGCSACCHMPALIYQHEADAMAAAAKCQALRIAYRPRHLVLQAALKFKGQPCPFLVENSCSIYEHRPLICRVHNSLNSDPSDCQARILDSKKDVYAIDPDIVENPYHQAVLAWNQKEPWGAIQEFFHGMFPPL